MEDEVIVRGGLNNQEPVSISSLLDKLKLRYVIQTIFQKRRGVGLQILISLYWRLCLKSRWGCHRKFNEFQ